MPFWSKKSSTNSDFQYSYTKGLSDETISISFIATDNTAIYGVIKRVVEITSYLYKMPVRKL